MASSKRKAYCVFGCSDLGAYMHRFPHPERRAEMFNTWLSIVGEKIKQTDRLRIYKNKRICNYHFKPEHKVASHRLLNSAVPSLHLSGIFSSFEISVQLEHNYSLPRMWPTNEKPEVDTLTPGPSDNACVTPGPSDNARVTPGPSDNARGLHNQHSSDEGQHKRSSAYFLKRYKASQRENRKLKAQLRKTMRKQMNYKTRLANAEKLVAGQAFDKVTKNMTLAGKIFTGMQYRQAKKKPKGRRFTIEEKVMALSFFKRSPKLYTLLYKHFALPSSKSLKIVLSQIKLSAGINKVIFEKLKDTVSGMNENDRLCTLIFDEMSLTPNIQYDCNNDELKGFVSHNDKMNVANHALVFMIKGIKMNYKQPVAYFFTQSLQKDDLKKILIEVIRHVHATGLKILCVVCDQAATNVSTLSSLVEDTKMKYLRKGKEWRREMFEVDSQEIIPLYDVPHLIKGVRNNLLTKDMIYTDFNDENKSKTVKWEYFQMLYEADKSYGELR